MSGFSTRTGVDLDTTAIKAALMQVAAPVLLYSGELDAMVTPAMMHQAAPLFSDANVVVQAGGGRFPWIDDPGSFAAALKAFLD